MTAGTLDAHLRRTAARQPTREAVVCDGDRLTYGDLDRRADAVAVSLRDCGVEPGDRVAVVMGNGIAAAVALYGVARAGAALVPLSPRSKPMRIARVLDHSGATAALAAPEVIPTLRAARHRLPSLRVVSGFDPPTPGRRQCPGDVLDVDLAAVLYTSGSTGEPKGAAFLHRNMDFVAASMTEFLELDADDRILSVLPLSHTYGLYQLIMSVRAGATLVLQDGMTLAGRIVAALETERITVLPGVPTLWHVLTSLNGLVERPLPDLRLLTNAGAALSVRHVEGLRRTFPHAGVIPIYGQTECKSACYLPPREIERRPSSVGIALPGTSVRLEAADGGGAAAPGELGELVIRGDHVMQGYWRDPVATTAALTPGRLPGDRELRSGDLFFADRDGYLYFVSRKDDVIITRGEKVAPREVEEVLLDAPGVRDAAVVGVPDDLRGAAIVAHVCADPGYPLDPGALRRHCAERLEDFRVPSAVVVHDELPRLENGKLDRLALTSRTAPPVRTHSARSRTRTP